MSKKKKILLNIRISEEDKKDIELASQMSGLSQSSIILDGALKNAKKILRDIEKGK